MQVHALIILSKSAPNAKFALIWMSLFTFLFTTLSILTDVFTVFIFTFIFRFTVSPIVVMTLF